jgi:hypothetical protein
MKTLGSSHLTVGYADPELVRQIGQTVAGMAHFSATGPLGTQCKDCQLYGYHRVIRNNVGDAVRSVFRKNCCGKFHELTGKHGDPIPATTESCRHFRAKA